MGYWPSCRATRRTWPDGQSRKQDSTPSGLSGSTSNGLNGPTRNRSVTPKRDGISPNPAWYGVVGRAEGLAAGVGVSDVRPVDLLLALLWDTSEWLPVTELGVSREAGRLQPRAIRRDPPSHPVAGTGPAMAEPCAGGLPHERPRRGRRGA